MLATLCSCFLFFFSGAGPVLYEDPSWPRQLAAGIRAGLQLGLCQPDRSLPCLWRSQSRAEWTCRSSHLPAQRIGQGPHAGTGHGRCKSLQAACRGPVTPLGPLRAHCPRMYKCTYVHNSCGCHSGGLCLDAPQARRPLSLPDMQISGRVG